MDHGHGRGRLGGEAAQGPGPGLGMAMSHELWIMKHEASRIKNQKSTNDAEEGGEEEGVVGGSIRSIFAPGSIKNHCKPDFGQYSEVVF